MSSLLPPQQPAKYKASDYTILYYPTQSITDTGLWAGQRIGAVISNKPQDITVLETPVVPGAVYSPSFPLYEKNTLPSLSQNFNYTYLDSHLVPANLEQPDLLESLPLPTLAHQSKTTLLLVLLAGGLALYLIFKYKGRLKSVLKF